MSIEVFLAFIIASMIIVAVPGPNIVLIINDSVKHGFQKSMFTILGIKAGILVLLLVSLSGLAAILSLFSSIFIIIKWAGVCYLLYLGISQIISSFKISPAEQEYEIAGNSFFLKGFLVSVTNPKGLLFAGAFFPQFLNRESALAPQIFILCGGFIIMSIIIEMIYAYAGDRTGKIFQSEVFRRITERISGVFLIIFGFGLMFVKENK